MSQPSSLRKTLLSGMIGNGLEWYDYALYGQMAVILGRLFFPGEDATLQLMATYGAFAAGFIARPFGGILFGWLGDRYGRRKALTLSILLMAACSGAIGLMPTYAQIGLLAPVLLTLIRIIQGLSLGGEFSGAITYMVEHGPTEKRGLVGSAAMASLVLGFLAGSLVAWFFIELMPTESFESWGWRIPFILGIFIGLAGFYIRHQCDESPVYEQALAEGLLSERPLTEVLTRHIKPLLQGVGVYFLVTMPFYMGCVYFIGFNKDHLGLDMKQAITINSLCMFSMLLMVPLSGWLSDRFTRRKTLLIPPVLFLLFSYPLMQWMQQGDVMQVTIAQLIFCAMVGLQLGPVPALLVELFSTRVRCTGMSLAYNIAAASFGGTAPIVSLWLMNHYGIGALAAYIMLAALCGGLAMLTYRDRSHLPI
ncbi:MFS transporter [bacterium]|nr:MFS transporter [bacterium]